MALLDEAMALACGAADDVSAAGQSACSFSTACYYAGDFGRAGSWAELLRRNGVIGPAAGNQVFLSSHCDSVQATLLMELGRWGGAEALLERSRAEFEQVMQMPKLAPRSSRFLDLRIRQGRWSEAETLLLGKDQAMQALLPAARLHLARGDLALARAAVCRGLRVLGDDRLRAVELLTILVDAELAAGDVAAAADAADRFELLLTDVSVPALLARRRGAARVLAASGQPDAAVAALEAFVDGLASTELPWLRVMVQLELVRT